MIYLSDLGSVIRHRRKKLGLSQSKLAEWCGLSRQTMISLEKGTLHELGFNRIAQVLNMLGLDLYVPEASTAPESTALWAAAKTASISYKTELDPSLLAQILADGDVPDAFIAHIAHLLDEVPLVILVRAVDATAEQKKISPRRIWKNIAIIAKDFDLSRQGIFA